MRAGSLRASLIEAAKDADISGSLVVTPEAFNIRNGYWSPDRQLDPYGARRTVPRNSRSRWWQD